MSMLLIVCVVCAVTILVFISNLLFRVYVNEVIGVLKMAREIIREHKKNTTAEQTLTSSYIPTAEHWLDVSRGFSVPILIVLLINISMVFVELLGHFSYILSTMSAFCTAAILVGYFELTKMFEYFKEVAETTVRYTKQISSETSHQKESDI